MARTKFFNLKFDEKLGKVSQKKFFSRVELPLNEVQDVELVQMVQGNRTKLTFTITGRDDAIISVYPGATTTGVRNAYKFVTALKQAVERAQSDSPVQQDSADFVGRALRIERETAQF